MASDLEPLGGTQILHLQRGVFHGTPRGVGLSFFALPCGFYIFSGDGAFGGFMLEETAEWLCTLLDIWMRIFECIYQYSYLLILCLLVM